MEREVEEAEDALAARLAAPYQLARRRRRVHGRRDVREVRAGAGRLLPALDVRVQVREDEVYARAPLAVTSWFWHWHRC